MTKKLLMNNYSENGLMPVMDGLICWLDGRDIPSNGTITNDTIWINRAPIVGENNAIIKTINGNELQNNDIDYFRTSRNAYVILPTFEGNSDDGLSFYIDAKINQRPNAPYDRAITLGYGTHYQTHIALNCGGTEYGRIRCFYDLPSYNFLDPEPTFKVGASSGSSVTYGFAKNYISNIKTGLSQPWYNSIFNNNFLCAESSTMLNEADISYGLVLIYNRALTEEEMQHNYEYSLTIERG